MAIIRKIRKVMRSKPTIEGAGVHLKRAFGYHDVPRLDPFLLLDDFHSNKPEEYVKGFPWHPHRGIETITYVLCGKVEHSDSMGNRGVIRAGDIQWMTAGSGIIHQEMTKGGDDDLMWGFQLWANLPAAHKMMAPRYRGVKADQVPEATLHEGVKVKVICGAVKGVKGPVHDILIEPEYLDFTVSPGSSFTCPVGPDRSVFAYVIEGEGYFDQGRDCYAYEVESANYFDLKRECLVGPENLIIFDEGEKISVSTEEKPVRFLLVSGKPLKEPVAWYGPIVMNTQEELRIAFDEYEKGTFIKHDH
jgi:redox-sensitive bicupin YhaK (pirin superfamily)